MDAGHPRRALDALSGEHALPILRFLQSREWTLASEVAEALRIHTTTAGKYLAAFHEAGFVDRRPHRARRATHAYRLSSSVIRIELDLTEEGDATDVAKAAEAFAGSLLDAARRLGGERLAADLNASLFGGDSGHDVRARLARSRGRGAIEALIKDARRACANLVGKATASRLVRIAAEAAFEGRDDLVARTGASA